MAISFVGSGAVGFSTAGATFNFSSLLDAAGGTPTLQQNDLVIVSIAYRTTTGAGEDETPTGYTAAYSNIFQDSTGNDVSLKTTYKFMGASPDTSVVLPAANSRAAAVIHVLRGVNTTTPLDVTPTTAGTANTATNPNAPAITPVTAGAWIYVVGGTATTTPSAAITNSGDLSTTTNHFKGALTTNTVGAVAAGLKEDWVSGSFDPAAFTGGGANSTGSTAAASVAFRPAAGGTTYNDTLTESLTAASALATIATFPNAMSESLTGVMSLATTVVFPNALSETLASSDSLATSVIFPNVLAESVTGADSFATAATFPNALSENVTGADSFATAATFPNTLSESVASNDNFVGLCDFPSTLSEALSASDSTDVGLVISTLLTESATCDDSYDHTAILPTSLIENLTADDTLDSTATFNIGYAEALTVNVTYLGLVGGQASVTHNATLIIDLPERLEISLPTRLIITIADSENEIDLPSRRDAGG